MKKRIFVIAISVMVVLSLIPAMAFADTNVAEAGGRQYATLQEAIADSEDGSTVKLLSDVTENITLNKNITVDGADKYTIKGKTTVKSGTLQNITITPNEPESGALFSIGSGEKTTIRLENVTVRFSLSNRSSGNATTLDGNQADITFYNCRFVNEADNGGNLLDAKEWSYGLYINGQGSDGSIEFINSEFNGAFRTMIPNAGGKMLIDNCKFINSVYSVLNGPTGGSGAEATVITTSGAANNDITVTGSTFDNAGAIYLQTQARFENNRIIADKEMHYIQVRGTVGSPVDFSKNTFETGDNHYIMYDTPGAPGIMPAGEVVLDGWVWNDTPEDVRPADYSDYMYMYNEDGSVTYLPQSDVALEQFLVQGAGNKQVKDGDTVLIEKDLKLPEMEVAEGRNFTIEIADNATLEITKNLSLNADLTITGNGRLRIGSEAVVTVSKDAALNAGGNVKVENNGKIENEGSVSLPEGVTGNGSITGSGTVAEVHNMKHFEAVEPTCTTKGNIEYWYCEGCDKYFLDKEGNKEVTKAATIIAESGHTYEDGVCIVCSHKLSGGDSEAKPDTNVKPEINVKPEKPDSPQTGDENNMMYPAVMLLAAALLTVAAYKRKKS